MVLGMRAAEGDESLNALPSAHRRKTFASGTQRTYHDRTEPYRFEVDSPSLLPTTLDLATC